MNVNNAMFFSRAFLLHLLSRTVFWSFWLLQYRLVFACAAPHAAFPLHVICEYIFTLEIVIMFTILCMHTSLKMLFIFLKLDFMFLKLDLRFLKLVFIFLKLDFIFLKLVFIFLNSGLKRCSHLFWPSLNNVSRLKKWSTSILKHFPTKFPTDLLHRTLTLHSCLLF